MKLLTQSIETKLRANAAAQTDPEKSIDHKPVVKFFTPDGAATWLITEMLDSDTLFGLCDLGLGCPELGYVSLAELKSVRGKLGLPIERDLHFTADKTLSAYADEARQHGRIKA
jgi:hypothetical protein